MSSFLRLKGSFHFHLLLKTVHEIDFLPESILVFSALSGFFLTELAVAALFLLLNLLTLGLKLFCLTLAKQFDVLILKGLILTALRHLVMLSHLLLAHLFIKLCSNQTATLLLPHHLLLLLFVVQKRVKLLDGSPLVLLSQL